MTLADDALSPKARFGEAWERLFDPPIAHRGLWSPDGAPENSLAAFRPPARTATGSSSTSNFRRMARPSSSMTPSSPA